MIDKQLGDSFLGSCWDLYKSGIYPFSVTQYDSLAYRQHQTLAQKFIQQEGLQVFNGAAVLCKSLDRHFWFRAWFAKYR